MLQAPSIGVKDLLEAASIGTFAATSGWGIFISREPMSPDTAITIYDTGGGQPNPKWTLDYPSLQVRVRGAKGGYADAWTKINRIRDELLGLPSQTIGGDAWRAVNIVGDIATLGYDNEERPLLTLNLELIVETAVGDGHRTVIS